MNVKAISLNVGKALLVSALFMLLSIGVSLLEGRDAAFTPLLISFIITLLVGSFPFIFVRKAQALSMNDGFLTIVLSWVLSFIFGMLPYVLYGGEFTLINAWFESVSGYTTTGSTILTDVEALPRSLLFWRSSTHFIGGLGVVVFLLLVMGKSSIIRSIAGLNKNISGEISLTRKEGDEPVSLIGLKPEEMVRRGISLSPEGRRILPHLTVVENLRLGAYSRTDKDGINEDIERVYALFPRLKERHWQKGGTLSGGEQQMLAVGRALMSRPDMIMLDEPSLGLAPLLVKEIFNIIRRINEDGMTVLLVEQNAFAALSVAHYAYILEVGRVVLEGTGQELLENPKVKEAYLGG